MKETRAIVASGCTFAIAILTIVAPVSFDLPFVLKVIYTLLFFVAACSIALVADKSRIGILISLWAALAAACIYISAFVDLGAQFAKPDFGLVRLGLTGVHMYVELMWYFFLCSLMFFCAWLLVRERKTMTLFLMRLSYPLCWLGFLIGEVACIAVLIGALSSEFSPLLVLWAKPTTLIIAALTFLRFHFRLQKV